MNPSDQPSVEVDEYTIMDTVNVTEVGTDTAFTLTFAIGEKGGSPAAQMRALTAALIRSAAYYDQVAAEMEAHQTVQGVWVVTQTKGIEVRHYHTDSESSAQELATNLPGNIEVTYQYSLGEE